MALEKQNMSISFAQGLDTKTGPRQVVPGKMLVLTNSKFTVGQEFTKRNGYPLLTATLDGVGNGLASFRDELIGFGQLELDSYVPESHLTLNKGYSQPIDVVAKSVAQPIGTGNGVNAGSAVIDSVVHSSGYALYVFNTAEYIITSNSSNQVVISESVITNSSGTTSNVGIKCFALGAYFIITYRNVTGNKFEYVAIHATTLAINAPVVINATFPTNGGKTAYDGAVSVAHGILWLAHFQAAGAMKIYSISDTLVVTLQNSLVQSPTTISMWNDEVLDKIWLSLYDGTDVKYVIFAATDGVVSLSATTIDTVADITKLIGGIVNSAGTNAIIYTEQQTLHTDLSLCNTIRSYTLTSAGAVGAGAVIEFGGSLFTRVFKTSNLDYNLFGVVYGGSNGSNLQNTIFILSHHAASGGSFLNSGHNRPQVVAKLNVGTTMPYTAIASTDIYMVTSVTTLSSGIFQYAYAKATRVFTNSSGTAVVTLSYNISAAVLDFTNLNAYQFSECGGALQITGGYASAYDSSYPNELNFHLFPEIVGTRAIGAGNIANGDYKYKAIYEWTDANGNLHQSAPSPPFSHTVSGGAKTYGVEISTLQFTEKQNGPIFSVKIALFRDAPTVSTGVFYRLPSGISNNPATSEQEIIDNSADADIIGNEQLYTVSGELANSGGPACSGSTIYKSRLMLIDAEDRNVLWFSKQIFETTPVEMSAEQTLFIDPRFGPMTAISVMDDKLIIFKSNAAFYLVGTGPDATGANNDFSDAIFISSNAGCVDPKSVVSSQDGLYFKSNKGVYLLDRGMNLVYIGAPVESYNSSTITSATLIPNSTEIRFTLNSGVALNYDYFYKQWSVYAGVAATGAAIYGGTWCYVDSSGLIYREADGVYHDGVSASIYQSLTTSWLSLSGLQGFERIYALYLLTKYISAHTLTIGIAYDFNPTIAQTITVDPVAQAAYNGSVGQWKFNINLQKCQSIQLTITESAYSPPVNGGGLNIENIGVVVGAKKSYPRLPAVQAATS